MRPGEIYAQYAADFYSYCLNELWPYVYQLIGIGASIFILIIAFNAFRFCFSVATDTEETFEINHHRYGNSDDW